MDVVRIWTGHLARRGWRATVFLVVLAGLAGGITMAAWSTGRRTATAFDRFAQYADPPEVIATFCPPDVVVVDEASLAECFTYDAAEEVEVLRGLPEVESAVRASFRGLTVARPDAPTLTTFASSMIVRDDGMSSVGGEPILVAGRWLSRHATDEVVANERFIDETGIAVGDEIVVTFWAPNEIGKVTADGDQLHGPSARVRVVGVVRGLLDLAASSQQPGEAELIAGPAFAAALVEQGGFGGVAIRARDGDGVAAAAAVERAFPGRRFNLSSAVGDDEIEPIREAIRYEARGAMAFAAIAALAATVFVGQAVARQSGKEWADLPTLRALGMSDRDVRWSAGLRGAMIGAAAALLAAGLTIALSPLGPIGVGRRAETDPGFAVDGLVLALGSPAVVVVAMMATWLPVRRHGRRVPGAALSPRRRVGGRGPFPVTAIAGLAMNATGRRDRRGVPIGTALAGVALAVATTVAAAGVTSSLDALTKTPARFGAPWTISVANAGGDELDQTEALTELLRNQPGVEAAAGIVGTDVEIQDETIWVQAFRPIGDLDGIRPVITAGREPVAIDEIALGSITRDKLDAHIGDTIEVRSTVTGAQPTTMTVVGTTIVNDTFETSPGRGGIVTLAWLDANSPELSADPYVVRLTPDADVDAISATIEAQLSAVVSAPTPQGAIRNIERIAALPYLLAALVGVLAIASLAHTLVLSIRRSHAQLAIWKSIGFTRHQIRAAVACHATTIALAATVLGVPLGIAVGRIGWHTIADQIGVASPPVTSAIGITASALAATILANLIAAYPAFRAARLPTADALRVE